MELIEMGMGHGDSSDRRPHYVFIAPNPADPEASTHYDVSITITISITIMSTITVTVTSP